jgi:hypothetical protein
VTRQWLAEAVDAHEARQASLSVWRSDSGGGSPRSGRAIDAQPSPGVDFGPEGSVSFAGKDEVDEYVDADEVDESGAFFIEPPTVATVLRRLRGVPVEARYKGRAAWFGAVVESARDDGSLNLFFDDGDHAFGAPRFRVRMPGQVGAIFIGLSFFLLVFVHFFPMHFVSFACSAETLLCSLRRVCLG